MIWRCPKCDNALVQEGNSARCALGHSYDFAKEGYINLLLSATGGTHGDAKGMVEARRRFLETGAYAPLREKIATLVRAYLPKGGTLLDAGCGEGYYTQAMAEAVDACGRVVAFDISKEAVRRTAKRCRTVDCAVASAYAVPLLAGSVDLLTEIFSPFAKEEFCRLLKEDGIFLMVIPEREHLYALKEAIYDTPYKNEPASTALDGFRLLENVELQYSLTVENAALRDLFYMTPYAYRTDAEGRKRVEELSSLTTQAHFRILVYQKQDIKASDNGLYDVP